MDKCVERVFQKNSLNPNAASHNNANWHTDTDGFLQHSPRWGSLYYKGPTLQKIIPFSEIYTKLYLPLDIQISIFIKRCSSIRCQHASIFFSPFANSNPLCGTNSFPSLGKILEIVPSLPETTKYSLSLTLSKIVSF